MNEINRQAYLAVLGIDSYMPRWRLALAPAPIACSLPKDILVVDKNSFSSFLPTPRIPSPHLTARELPKALNEVIAEIGVSKTVAMQGAAISMAHTKVIPDTSIVQPFTLSIWRPSPGFLIIDSRNTKLALPTEVLLHNILNSLEEKNFSIKEEVLRWPAIENSFVSRTLDDACNELQTWLAVENELRPITKLWLLGENSFRYFGLTKSNFNLACWTTTELASPLISALILPSLNDLLLDPMLKAKLWSCVH